MGFTIAVELASLTEKNQRTVLDAMEKHIGYTKYCPRQFGSKNCRKTEDSAREKIEEFLSEIKQKDADRVVFKNEQLYRYFPS